VLTPDGKKVDYGSAPGLKAWEFYASLPLTYKVVPPSYLGAGITWESYYTPFMVEQAAMMTIGDWAIAPMKQGNPKLDYAVAPLPKGVKQATVIGGYTLGMSSTSQNPEPGWTFLKWLTAEPQEWVLEGYSRIPARVDVVDSAFGKSPLEVGFLEQAKYGLPQPEIPQWDSIVCNAMSNGWDATIHKTVTPAEGLKMAVQQGNSYLSSPPRLSEDLKGIDAWNPGVWDAPGWGGQGKSGWGASAKAAGKSGSW
jgi:multiple sugar transport system substrate-binding protein